MVNVLNRLFKHLQIKNKSYSVLCLYLYNNSNVTTLKY